MSPCLLLLRLYCLVWRAGPCTCGSVSCSTALPGSLLLAAGAGCWPRLATGVIPSRWLPKGLYSTAYAGPSAPGLVAGCQCRAAMFMWLCSQPYGIACWSWEWLCTYLRRACVGASSFCSDSCSWCCHRTHGHCHCCTAWLTGSACQILGGGNQLITVCLER